MLGFASAWLTVTHFGPSALLETHAIRSAVLAATACVLAGVMLAATTIGVLADRSVDHPTRHVHARFLLPLGCLTLCALTLWSFRRLDTVGGIRTYGVQARGGDMLALGFPLSLLLAVTAATALVLRAAITHARLSGGRLPRALRLGWRRVVLEAGPTVATVAAAALAAGSMITATALAFEPTMGAEDFSYFLLEKPGAYFVIGNGEGNHREHGHGLGPCTLHNPNYDFNDQAIPLGASLWVRLAEAWFQRP